MLVDSDTASPLQRYTDQKQRQSVQRQTKRMENKVVQPDLRILERFQNVAPGETFILRGIAIVLQALVHSSSFVLVEEFRLRGPVGDIPKGCNGKDAGQDAFDDKDPAL